MRKILNIMAIAPCDILQDTGGGARPEFLEETGNRKWAT